MFGYGVQAHQNNQIKYQLDWKAPIGDNYKRRWQIRFVQISGQKFENA